MRNLKEIIIVFLFIRTFALSQTVPLSVLHQNDQNGVYSNPDYPLGSSVTVSGIATVSSGLFSSSLLDAYIQDETAGMMIYSPNRFSFDAGDSLLVTGTIKQYNGITEIQVSELEVLKSGLDIPEPLVLTCDDVDHAFLSDYSEPHEGRLIQLQNVSLSGNWPNSVNLEDSSGSCLLYVDTDTDVDEISLNSGTYTITGILKQYDRSRPYTDGYEIIPRFPQDIETPWPLLSGDPVVSNLTENGFDVEFYLDKEGVGILQLWEVGSDVIETEIATNSAFHHVFKYSGLWPGTIYELTPGVMINNEELFFNPFYTVTSCNDDGDFQVYFNQSVDTSLVFSTQAKGQINIEEKIIERIENANYSIDLCAYSFSLQSIADALVDAQNRRVRIRVIYDTRNEQSAITFLRDNGIPVITNDFGINDGEGIMHNKILIIDNRNRNNSEDDWIITGSANFTYYGLHDNAQNMLFIQNKALASVYTKEFEEMWGSSSDEPSETQSRFGAMKIDNTPHEIFIGNTLIEQYMGPSDRIIDKICETIRTADYSIYFSILAFTHQDIEEALKKQLENHPNLVIKGIFDADNADYENSIYPNMKGEGSAAWDNPQDVLLDQGEGLLHHKVMIIDAERSDSDPVVITGSANWSYSTANYNNENSLIIHNDTIAQQYLQEFAARYYEAGGNDVITEVEETKNIEKSGLVKVFPQPANQIVNFQLFQPSIQNVQIKIYNLSGQIVLKKNFQDQNNVITVDMSSFSSGIYLCQLETQNFDWHGKIFLIK